MLSAALHLKSPAAPARFLRRTLLNKCDLPVHTCSTCDSPDKNGWAWSRTAQSWHCGQIHPNSMIGEQMDRFRYELQFSMFQPCKVNDQGPGSTYIYIYIYYVFIYVNILRIYIILYIYHIASKPVQNVQCIQFSLRSESHFAGHKSMRGELRCKSGQIIAQISPLLQQEIWHAWVILLHLANGANSGSCCAAGLSTMEQSWCKTMDASLWVWATHNLQCLHGLQHRGLTFDLKDLESYPNWLKFCLMQN